MYYYDYTYLIFVLPALIISLWAQLMVKTRISHYSKIESKRHLTGAQVAQYLLRANGITDVSIRHIPGNLTDNYNPSTKTLNLSDTTYNSTSIAAIGVAAHETGHAIQHNVNYGPLWLRSALVPVANFGSNAGPLLVMVGLILGSLSSFAQYSNILWYISVAGIIAYSLSVLFYLITLPVEFNASRRALAIIRKSNALDKDEIRGARKCLSAAAMTYVAAALSALLSLLRLIVISRGSKK